MPEHKILQPYKHECDHCSFIGWMPTERGMANAYVCRCPGASAASLLIRYSDEPHDYMTMRIPEEKRAPWPLIDTVPESQEEGGGA